MKTENRDEAVARITSDQHRPKDLQSQRKALEDNPLDWGNQTEMATGPWQPAENDLIVADYFAMLASDLAGRPYNKARHNERLRNQIKRSRGSIEYKHRNISAVLQGLGETWIFGYKPAFSFQMTLVDAVVRWLHHNPQFQALTHLKSDASALVIEPAPPVTTRPRPDEFNQLLSIAREFDVAERAEANRVLGRAGEERVLAHERARLTGVGRSDLSKRVRWVSQEDGDGAGYDVASFWPDGRSRLIEVKTTNGWERTPFYISRNELAVAAGRPSEWRLVRLWNFARRPRAFELHPPLDTHVVLTATNFEASFPLVGEPADSR